MCYSSEMHKNDLILLIQRKSEECLLHADEPGQRESYFFWKIMELFCEGNGKAMMSQVATILFRSYRCLRKKASRPHNGLKQDWCLSLAALLCAVMPADELIKAVIDMGDRLATKGLTFAAHLCYVVAFKEPDFGLIGCKSLPDKIFAMKGALERTEVYEYMLGLASGCPQPNFLEFKILYAYKLFESGLLNQALDYCKTIASAVATFPDRITITLLDQLIRLSEKLNKGKGNEPEWLLNLRLLHKEESDLFNSCTEREEHAEMPPHLKVANTPAFYFGREREYRAFRYLTQEITSQYLIGELLGHGGGGVVYTGIRIADGREVAVKFAVRDEYQEMITIPGETTPVPVEVGLMEMASKPFCDSNILELLDWFNIPGYMVLMLEKPNPCMNLTEFCKIYGGNLPEPLARDILVQVVQAARHCCDCGVFHNDIKLGNILINPQTLQIKLIDFGSGELLKDMPYTFSPGTPGYFPPEWCRYRKYMGRPATVWTLGVILFQMLYGRFPFQSAKETVTGHLHFPPGVSEDCCVLISWCLAQNPKSRPNFRQIFKHKWLMGGPSYIQRFPVIGGLVARLIRFLDYYRIS